MISLKIFLKLIIRLSSQRFVLIYQQNYYTVKMSGSAVKDFLNKDEVGQSETLLDFLKRKKKYQLENTVNKSLYQSYAKPRIEGDAQEQFPSTKEERTKYSTQYISHRNTSRNFRQTITPKKIQFEDNQTFNNYNSRQIPYAQTSRGGAGSRGKNFLSMISPSKSRPNSVLQQNRQQIQNIPKSTRKWTKGSQNYTRRNLAKCVNSLKQTMHYLADNVNNIKQKSRGLSLLFNPIFNYLTESSHPVSRQVGDLRNKLKSFQAMIEGIQSNNSDSVVENFHKNVEQHLEIQEGNIRKEFQRAKNQELAFVSTEKQKIINNLQIENKKIQKENEILLKKLDKIESHKYHIQEAANDRQQNLAQQLDRLKSSYEQKINQLTLANKDVNRRYQQLLEQSKEHQRQLKDERFMREEIQQKLKAQIKEISEVKDAYLLNEIMVLKSEFSSDICRINELHKLKQAQLLAVLQTKQQELNKKSFERGCDKQIQSKILIEANQIKQQNAHLKSKADCIITDMYRMNEELFQHWMALKDIKILTNRLGNYAQIKKIYEDLMFNDQLFH